MGTTPQIKDFELSPAPSTNSQAAQKIMANVVSTEEILQQPSSHQSQLRQELEQLFAQSFSQMSSLSLQEFVDHYFRKPGNPHYHIHALFFRTAERQLVATSIFVYGDVHFEEHHFKGSQIIVSAVLPPYQNSGIAKSIGIKILTEMQPDVLFTTCAQSAALYSRLGLITKKQVQGFDVYPRLEMRQGQELVIPLPHETLDFAVTTFAQTYFMGFAAENQNILENTLRNLSIFFARKHIDVAYEFHPWQQNGRTDKIAQFLGVGEDDGVLVMFKKTDLQT